MWLENMKENKYTLFLLIIIGIAFYLMNIWTPLYSDDWHYCFIFGTHIPIDSIHDILISQYRHYFEFNGRLVPHLFVQLFDGIVGKAGFNIANTIIWIVFLHLLIITIPNSQKLYYKLLTLSTTFILLLIPGFKNCFLWMSGACNYLWTITLLLFFHHLLQREDHIKVLYPFLLIIGIICGWTHEGLVIGLTTGYIVYYILHWKELSPSRTILLLGLSIGTLFLIFAPSNIHRALDNIEVTQLSDIFRMYGSALLAMTNLRIFFITSMSLFALWLYRRNFAKKFVQNNLIWITAACISFIFVVFTRHNSPHSRFGIEVFSLIILLNLFTYLKISHAWCTRWNILLGIFLILILQGNFNNYQEFQNIIAQIEQTNNKIIKSYPERMSDFCSRFSLGYANKTAISSAFNNNWENSLIANYYNKNSFIILSENFLSDLKLYPNKYEHFHTLTEIPFYAKRIAQEETPIKSVSFLLQDMDKNKVPFYYRPFANKMARYSATEITTDRYTIVEIDNKSYLLVEKIQ